MPVLWLSLSVTPLGTQIHKLVLLWVAAGTIQLELDALKKQMFQQHAVCHSLAHTEQRQGRYSHLSKGNSGD